MTLLKTVKGTKIVFSINAPGASEVMLAGDFNCWDDRATPMQKSRNNNWTKNITLQPGRYEYKFVVDGNWLNDPSNNNKVWNSLGSENSVIEVS